MRNNIPKSFYLLFLMLCLVVFTICKKLEKEMLVSTGEVTNISTNTADASGLVIDLGEGATGHGHCYAKTPDVTIDDLKKELGIPPGTGGFTSQLTNLEAGTKYYINAYLSNGSETVYGKEISFSTSAASLPSIETAAITSITTTTATSGGNITSDGGAPVTARGVCWNTATGPSISNSKTTDGAGSGSFASNLSGLTPGTTYYVRAYATNSVGTAYGNEIEFKTSTTVPTITTTAITNSTTTTANSGGNISSDGGAPVTARGVCWKTSTGPTISDSKTSNDTGTGSFISNLTGLTASTTYYIRAYATNSAGTAYGNELSFTTGAVVAASLSTAEITSITTTTAVSGGNITNDGGAPVTVRGVCWKTSSGPTISDNKTSDGTGSGSFSSNLTGLKAGTTYYIRAYATNSSGTAYGNEISFTTSIIVPVLSTSSITSVTTTTAVSGGNISDNGGASVTVRGVCWSTSAGPTIADNKTSDGTGSGTFVSNITGLAASTTYFIRAYATNSAGTSYGNELSFTTNALTVATLSTAAITSITTTGAVSGGIITSDGGAEVTARGICWSTSANPTIADTKTTDGSGTGSFISNLTGLSASTKYYIRAYAINTIGTAYGNEISFLTYGPTVTDIDGNVYNTVIIGSQTWLKENLKVTKYRNGSAIPNLTDGLAWASTTSGAYCYYKNDINYLSTYGCLYNWYATIDNRNICPAGWHVPNDNDWQTLITYLGENSGGKLKSTSLLWSSPNTGATNESGFSALPAGFRETSVDAFFYNESFGTDWWAITEYTTTNAKYLKVEYNSGNTSLSNLPKRYGASIRCLQGEGFVSPTITTSAISSITTTTATCGGDVTSDGGSTVTTRGVCWSISANPTIANSKSTNGSGTGVFTSNLTGLSAETKYYVRAYATNSIATAYGNEISFTTSAPSLPTLSTTSVSDMTQNSAKSGGNITSDGGGSVIARGICWSTAANPTTADNKTSDATGSGSFISTLTGLTMGITYYVRAYATNSAGTAYGNELSFTISASCIGFQVTHTAGDVAPVTKTVNYSVVSTDLTGTGKCWIMQNLGADNQASSVADATEAAAGWYWQFNRKQGYKHDGFVRTPNTTWITPISETSNWIAGNDPCNLLLGANWRIPTLTELAAVEDNGLWTNFNDLYASVFKMHPAGYLHEITGSLSTRGTSGSGNFWSSTNVGSTIGGFLYTTSTQSGTSNSTKANGYTIRCLKD